VAACHRFKLNPQIHTAVTCHAHVSAVARQGRGRQSVVTAVFMTSSDFVVTLYSFGLDGNPTKLVPSVCRHSLRLFTVVSETLMALRLGDIAPDFEQESSEGRIRFHDWLGELGCPVLAPGRLHPVCTTELGLTAKLKEEFASATSRRSPCRWIAWNRTRLDPGHQRHQSTSVNFPILADGDRKVSELYDMIHPNANET
jgi:peroxiredoxin